MTTTGRNEGPSTASATAVSTRARGTPRHAELLPLPRPGNAIAPVPGDLDGPVPDRAPGSNAATAASAASVRALSAQVVAFWFRAPAKAFFRTRVDYLAYARSVHSQHIRRLLKKVAQDTHASRLDVALRQSWLWLRSTTPGVLTSAVRQQGWSIIPQQILPPLLANVGVGAVLYTSYLQILGRLHEESGKASRRVYPPPPPTATFTAGLMAGALQSVVAAPLDALQARYDHRDMMPAGGKGRPRSMWSFGSEKLREIGLRGIFAGWGLSLAKDGLGNAIFFSAFEYVKAQGYYRFVTWYYGGLADDIVDVLAMKRPAHDHKDAEKTIIRPHYAIEPMFLFLAGTSASLAQQVLLHPLTHFQVKHWDHLEELDAKAARLRAAESSKGGRSRQWRMMRAYYHAYQESLAVCQAEAKAEGLGLARWLYRGFWWNSIRQVPSTSAGLIIFELIRRKYGFGMEEVRITKDGYDILLH
jgi:hypothetical protein